MENIWIAIIGFFKDIFVAIIDLFKNDKPCHAKKTHSKKYDASEERMVNPFIPSDTDVEKISINDSNYLPTLATYLASNRSPEDIKAIDKENKE